MDALEGYAIEGDWFSNWSGGGDNVTISDGFSFGPFATSQYDTPAGPPLPDGFVASQNTANSEWSWFDQSKLTASFGDVMAAGVGAFKTTLAQEMRGDNRAIQGQSFGSILQKGFIDNFTSTKTGKQIRSDVISAQIKDMLSNPMTWAIGVLGVVLLVVLLRR